MHFVHIATRPSAAPDSAPFSTPSRERRARRGAGARLHLPRHRRPIRAVLDPRPGTLCISVSLSLCVPTSCRPAALPQKPVLHALYHLFLRYKISIPALFRLLRQSFVQPMTQLYVQPPSPQPMWYSCENPPRLLPVCPTVPRRLAAGPRDAAIASSLWSPTVLSPQHSCSHNESNNSLRFVSS
jgi:hypothetical protein